MKTQIGTWILLALHLAGLVMMAGTTMVDYMTFKTFWMFADQGNTRSSIGLIPLMARYGALVRAGAGVLFITGIALLLLARGVWWQQPWFKVKMGLVVLLVLNGILMGNRQGVKLRGLVAAYGDAFVQHTGDVRLALSRFYIIQLTLFLLIILAGVIKPAR
ncbi:MAG TPA: DUF2214 family protein [Chitinophaga sp.]|uniref:DUF2214 family protein n=1 Tax=Chitinophaga sp. TaxID=1869181 RepID=UPI002DBB29C0|nr:DUF2214 family protein [Chitinophaga sp.]HEU4554605.1 DUF2214 family protein [Chitinophaga sp.]